MAFAAPKLSVQAFDLLDEAINAFHAYGLWDTVVALDAEGRLLSSHPAHDGDFFPEAIEDYVAAMQPFARGERAFISPVRVDVDITQVCNSDCTFCFSRDYRSGAYRRKSMSAEQVRRLIAGAATQGARSIRFCGGGEPLAHPDVCEVVPLVREHGMKACVITNGDLLDARRAALFAEVDHLRWSVNAATERTRRLLHRTEAPGSLSESQKWVGAIIAASARRTSSPTMVWATFLLVPENVQEIVSAGKMLRDLGVNSVSFRPVNHGLHTLWTFRKREVLAAALDEVQTLATQSFRVFTAREPAREQRVTVPGGLFECCLSRLVRPVVEAGPAGPLVQSCGTYRGRQDLGWELALAPDDFYGAPISFRHTPGPADAPRDCPTCIDIGINRVLAFLLRVLEQQPDARFVRGACRAMPASRSVQQVFAAPGAASR